MTDSTIDILRAGAEAYGITLDSDSCARFQQFAEMLADWSSRTNLVSKNDLSRLTTHHFLDSLKLASCVTFDPLARILDFGSGAGFPGIPLAIAFPASSVYLVESRKKRCEFLNAAVSELGLASASVLCTRIEQLGDALDNSCDLVVSRATVSLAGIYSLTARFVSPGGTLAAIKGEDIDEEFAFLEDTVDRRVFNILKTRPTHVSCVRDGWVTIIRRSKLSTTVPDS